MICKLRKGTEYNNQWIIYNMKLICESIHRESNYHDNCTNYEL
jgi:hypothetical protein